MNYVNQVITPGVGKSIVYETNVAILSGRQGKGLIIITLKTIRCDDDKGKMTLIKGRGSYFRRQ